GSQDLVFSENRLVSGSLDALIDLFLPCADVAPDPAYSFTFLLTSRLFVAPADLLFELSQCHLAMPHGQERRRLVEHSLALLDQWTKLFPYDFLGRKMSEVLRALCESLARESTDASKRLADLTASLLARLTAAAQAEAELLRHFEVGLRRLQEPPSAGVQDAVAGLLAICSDPAVLADQLTIAELERLRHLGPEELLQSFCQENPRRQPVLLEEKKVHFLEAYAHWFNRLSALTATEVCTRLRKRDRVRAVDQLVAAANACLRQRNFNSAMAILAGLSQAPVARLRRTWTRAAPGCAELEAQLSPAHNFGAYRRLLAEAAGRPAVPFFSLLLRDLFALGELTATRQANGYINFLKCHEAARLVAQLLAWRGAGSGPAVRRPEVQECLATQPVLSGPALAYASFECEPPDTEAERAAFRQLRERTVPPSYATLRGKKAK
ncbi:hypothetical protein BOX15_Mlig027185g2, partial [Macrostomum lignano]